MIGIVTLASYLHLQLLDTMDYPSEVYNLACKREFGMSIREFVTYVRKNKSIPNYVMRPRFVRGVTLPKEMIRQYKLTFPGSTIGNSGALMSDGSIKLAARNADGSKYVRHTVGGDYSHLPTGQICSFLVKEAANSEDELAIRVLEATLIETQVIFS